MKIFFVAFTAFTMSVFCCTCCLTEEIKNTENSVFDYGSMFGTIGGFNNRDYPEQEGWISAMCISFSENCPDDLYVSFHKNGHMSNLHYRNNQLNKIKRDVTWTEDGELLQERVITKPEPFKLTK